MGWKQTSPIGQKHTFANRLVSHSYSSGLYQLVLHRIETNDGSMYSLRFVSWCYGEGTEGYQDEK